MIVTWIANFSFGIVLHVLFTKKILKQRMNEKLGGIIPKLAKPSILIVHCFSFKLSNRPSFEEKKFLISCEILLWNQFDYEIISCRFHALNLFKINGIYNVFY